MIFIYLIIIIIISINGIQTKNSSSNHVIIIPVCQTNKTISITSGNRHQSYFYLFSQSSLFHLSYCDNQQTAYSLSSGFSILRSSPQLPLSDIVVKKHSSSSFHHDHNVTLSTTDQSILTNRNITILMSSTISNENPSPIYNMVPTTTISNVSLLHTTLSTTHNLTRTYNIMLIVGCAIIGIILLIIIYIIMKCCNRDEGSYKIDESINFATTSPIDNHDNNICSGKVSLSNHQHRQKLITVNEQNKNDSKEWYV